MNKDETSLLGNISDLYSESMNVFYIFNEDELSCLESSEMSDMKNRFRVTLDEK